MDVREASKFEVRVSIVPIRPRRGNVALTVQRCGLPPLSAVVVGDRSGQWTAFGPYQVFDFERDASRAIETGRAAAGRPACSSSCCCCATVHCDNATSRTATARYRGTRVHVVASAGARHVRAQTLCSPARRTVLQRLAARRVSIFFGRRWRRRTA